MTINERIRILRKDLGLTLEKFGTQIGTKKNTMSAIETGRNNVTEQMFKSICREFNVNEDWLRTGKGEMFNKSVSLSLNEFLEKQNATELEIEIVKLFFSVDKEIRNDLLKKLKNVFQSESKPVNEHPTIEQLNTDEDIENEVAEFRRHLILEKKQAEELKATKSENTDEDLA